MKLTTTARVINDVGLDAYLRGVVPIEMPASWPTEALRAQAIAARSYAGYRLHPSAGSFDVYDDTRSQVYRGVEAENAATNTAIKETAGKVAQERGVGRERDVPLHGRRRDREQRVRVRVRVGPGRGGAGLVPARVAGSGAGRTSYDAGSPYATWQTADVHEGRDRRDLQCRPADGRGFAR